MGRNNGESKRARAKEDGPPVVNPEGPTPVLSSDRYNGESKKARASNDRNNGEGKKARASTGRNNGELKRARAKEDGPPVANPVGL